MIQLLFHASTEIMSQNPLYQRLRILSVALFAVLVVLAVIVLTSDRNPEMNPPAIDAVGREVNRTLTDFTLIANDGRPLSLSDLHGQYVLITFGYTHCPDVCPTTMLEFRRIKQELAETAEHFRFVFISVDEGRDTPEVLDRFVRRFDPSFIGLQGQVTVLRQIMAEFDLTYEIRQNPDTDSANYLVDHTASKYLIDPSGMLIRIYSFADDAHEIAAELKTLN
jgi:protein SCO1